MEYNDSDRQHSSRIQHAKCGNILESTCDMGPTISTPTY